MDNNNRSGSSRINVPYEQELSKIAAMDDSIQPEVVGTVVLLHYYYYSFEEKLGFMRSPITKHL